MKAIKTSITMPETMAKEMTEDAKAQGMSVSTFIRHLYLIWRKYKKERGQDESH